MTMEAPFSSPTEPTKKRARGGDDDDSLLDSPGLKRLNAGPTRDDSPVSAVVDSDADEFASLRKDILDILDKPETVPETQELDSVIRSFEEEILQSKTVPEATSFPGGGTQPDLGFLLGASDDELGLPPATSAVAGEETKPQPEPVDTFDDLSEFQDELPGFDPFELDNFGLFDEVEGSEQPAWRPESLPAV